MRNVALISELSHHKLKAQKEEYPNMPHYIAPDEIPALLRPTTRKGTLAIHMISLAIAADKKQKFIDFFKSLPKNSKIVSKEDGNINYRMPIDDVVKLWGRARKRGASVAGGQARSDNAFLEFWEGFSRIKDRWHGDENSKKLMKEAGIKHHDTIRVHLGHTRWEWRNFSDAQRARKLKQLEKEVKQCLKNQ